MLFWPALSCTDPPLTTKGPVRVCALRLAYPALLFGGVSCSEPPSPLTSPPVPVNRLLTVRVLPAFTARNASVEPKASVLKSTMFVPDGERIAPEVSVRLLPRPPLSPTVRLPLILKALIVCGAVNADAGFAVKLSVSVGNALSTLLVELNVVYAWMPLALENVRKFVALAFAALFSVMLVFPVIRLMVLPARMPMPVTA